MTTNSKPTLQELENKLQEAHKLLDIKYQYYHYTDEKQENPYKILHLAINTNTHEVDVIYNSVKEPNIIWIKSLKRWLEPIDDKGNQRYKLDLIHFLEQMKKPLTDTWQCWSVWAPDRLC